MPMAWSVGAGEPAGPGFLCAWPELDPSLARVQAAPASGLRAVAKRPAAQAWAASKRARRPAPPAQGARRQNTIRRRSFCIDSRRLGPGSEAERPAPRVSGRLWDPRLVGFGLPWPAGSAPKRRCVALPVRRRSLRPGSFLRVGVAHSCAVMPWRLAGLCGGASCAARLMRRAGAPPMA